MFGQSETELILETNITINTSEYLIRFITVQNRVPCLNRPTETAFQWKIRALVPFKVNELFDLIIL